MLEFTAKATNRQSTLTKANRMSDTHDAWKDGYDAWKLAGPDDDCDDREDQCCHEEFDIDWEGRASCSYCLAHWWAKPGQIAAQQQHEAEYAEWVEQQHRRERWLKVTAPFRWLWYRLWMPLSPRTAIKSLDTDEIPF